MSAASAKKTTTTANKKTSTRRGRSGGSQRKSGTNLVDQIHATSMSVLQGVHQCVDSIGEILPDLWNKPVAKDAAAPREVSNSIFKIVGDVLDAQREFAKRLVDSVLSEAKKVG